ncbi:MAG: hypothetical protein JSU63_08370, partial [Phycisphaerales bacterium]
FLVLPGVLGAFGQEFELTRWTVDGGGAMFSTGGEFDLSGTIGQPDAGVMSGETFELAGGFWFPLTAGDCDSDGGVSLFDYDDFEPCLSGPNGGVTLDCRCQDIDRDGDVDLWDAASFQRSFTGG